MWVCSAMLAEHHQDSGSWPAAAWRTAVPSMDDCSEPFHSPREHFIEPAWVLGFASLLARNVQDHVIEHQCVCHEESMGGPYVIIPTPSKFFRTNSPVCLVPTTWSRGRKEGPMDSFQYCKESTDVLIKIPHLHEGTSTPTVHPSMPTGALPKPAAPTDLPSEDEDTGNETSPYLTLPNGSTLN